MRIVEAFPFFNEYSLLTARLGLLSDLHLHVVSEGDHTHQGEPKMSMILQSALEEPNLRHAVAFLSAGDGDEWNWRRENEQRDYLREMLGDLDPEDLVLLTDADEVPNPDAMADIIEATRSGPVTLAMRMIYYGIWEDPGGWYHSKAARVRDLPESLTALRLAFDLPVVWDAGWHLSYLGGEERLRTKVTSFAHSENMSDIAWARIRNGEKTGIGPNGEDLVPFDPIDLPGPLREAVYASRS